MSTNLTPTAEKLVTRDRLTRRLDDDSERVIVLCAPSGYGKSVLLRQWAESDPRPSFSILLGPQHSDPTVLVETIVEQLSALEPFPDELGEALLAPSPDVERVVVPRLRAALEARTEPFALALDELERIEHAPDALKVVAALCSGMPPGAQLALASRTEPPLGLGRMRASRRLTELGREDLTMTKAESDSLLASVGLDLSSPQLDALVQRTEGWPAALYLAGLALGQTADPGRALSRFTGDDRVVVDYLREEFLQPASRNRGVFLRQAAVLERLSGPLCDFALERDDSAAVLHELSRSNMLLVALDHKGEWYRLHPLLQEMLRSELRRTEADAVPGVHRRASEWWSTAGDADQAIHHAIEAGAGELAGELLFAAVPEYMTRGRNATLVGWLQRLGEQGVASSASASLTAAWTEVTLGCAPRAEHWVSVTRRLLEAEEQPRGDGMVAVGLALADAVLARDGLAAMRETIGAAEPLLPEDNPWRALTSLLDGVGLHLLGERDGARLRLKESVRRGSVGAPNLQALALAQLALIAVEQEDWQLAEAELTHARAQIERTGIADYPMLALAHATSAYVRTRTGALEKASADLDTGKRLLGALDHFAPWYVIETKLMLARASSRLGQRAQAERLLGLATAQLAEVPDGILLARWVEEASASLGAASGQAEAQLTAAELRVLQFLPEHLSFPQIADRLYISANTVKTHARSIYRKLGASSRHEAIERARESGLLDGG